MADYTTFRLGGPCPELIDCAGADAVEAAVERCAAEGRPFRVMGGGSNLLVSDAGIEETVIRFCVPPGTGIRQAGEHRVRVSGGAALDEVVRFCLERGIGDLVFCSGIPGTIGGAIAGNAGAFGRAIGEVVESVRLATPSGAVREAAGEELDFGYRRSRLRESGEIVLEATLRLPPLDSPAAARKERERILQLRRERHPDPASEPCAGSVFRNPASTSAAGRRQAAGWFLEAAGAFAMREGGAYVYPKHANIVIAGPGATAADVRRLMARMAAAVRDRFGLDLEPEIRFWGCFPPAAFLPPPSRS